MAMAADLTIAQVRQIVDLGEISPELVVTPGIFVDRVVGKEAKHEQQIDAFANSLANCPGHRRWQLRQLGDWRMPELVANYLPDGREIIIHSENGLLGMGPVPEDGQEDGDLVTQARNR